jgi:heme/copper-type cytochrome/quinol oxidase subunit 2
MRGKMVVEDQKQFEAWQKEQFDLQHPAAAAAPAAAPVAAPAK